MKTITRKKDGKKGIVIGKTQKGELIVSWLDLAIIKKGARGHEITDK